MNAIKRITLGGLTAAMMIGSVRVAGAQTCTGTPGPAGTIELTLGATMRQFVVRLPPGYDAKSAAPVVFAFHPFGMNPQYMQGRVPVHRAWPEAIAVFPAGFPRPGADGTGSYQPAWQGRPGEMDDRDLLFFDAMLAWLAKNHCVDRSRVFVMGYSNGANFASVIACERASVIAGVAIASGSLSCTLPAAKPVILSHGFSDQTITYERAIEAAQAWSDRNGCAAPPKNRAPGCFAADACSAAPVTLCTYDGGHEYNEPFTKTLVEFLEKSVKR